jgi:hypothetical protein
MALSPSQFCSVKTTMPSVPIIELHACVNNTKILTASQKYFYEEFIPQKKKKMY